MAATAKPNRFAAVAAQRSGPTPTPGSTNEAKRKYTVLLTERQAVDLDGDITQLRRRLGKRVDKSVVIRELVALLHEDPALFEHVVTRIG